jgi:hypothetical protein
MGGLGLMVLMTSLIRILYLSAACFNQIFSHYLQAFLLSMLNNCMNNYKNFKDDGLTADWLRDNGINVQTFASTNTKTLQAQQAATHLLEQHSTELDNASKLLLEHFRRCYADNNKRSKITDGLCYSVLNLAARVKRGQYKRNRLKRQAA